MRETPRAPTPQPVSPAGIDAPYHAMLDALPAAICTADATGRLTYYNDAAAALWGHRPALHETRWCGAWKLYEPDGTPLPHNSAAMAAALTERRAIRGREGIAERPDGTRVPFVASATPLFDGTGALTGAVNMLEDIGDRVRARAEQELLLAEVKHRAKNLAAVIEAIGRQSRPRNEPAVDAFFTGLMGRMRALLSVGEMLFDSAERQADLRRVAETTLAPFQDPNDPSRIAVDGPALSLSEHTAGGLALAFHELATNAAKYGALSTSQGRIALSWSVGGEADADRVRIAWQEHGVENVREPQRRGFGSRVIGMAISGERGAETHFAFEPGGVQCRFEFSLL